MDIENHENDFSSVRSPGTPLRGSVDIPATRPRHVGTAIVIAQSEGDNDIDSIGLEPMDLSDDQFEPSNNNRGDYSSTRVRPASGYVGNRGQMIPLCHPEIDRLPGFVHCFCGRFLLVHCLLIRL